jgi:hypothetical protein
MKTENYTFGAAVLLAIGAGMWIWQANKTIEAVRPEIFTPAEVLESAARTREIRQLRLPTVEWQSMATDADESMLVGRLMVSMNVRNNAASFTMARRLAETISKELVVRASTDVETYVEHAQRVGRRWSTPSDARQWRKLGVTMTVLNDGTRVSEFTPEDVLRTVVTHELLKNAQITEFGTGSDGMRIDIYEIDSHEDLGCTGLTNGNDLRYWYAGGGHSGDTITLPTVSREDVFKAYKRVIMAEANMMVRTASGHMYNLRTFWFWSPSDQRWMLSHVTRYTTESFEEDVPLAIEF